MKSILEIQDLGKKYRIQHLSGGYLSFRERLQSMVSFKKEQMEDFWALKDVSFNVQPGESIGIIGRNGAGKSTLLKILSKITPPSTGKIISRGRIASLLEVGTGFHPELTGRENIFFNGSLLGMKRKEIESKFDEIIDFSGVEKFLDTPLKHFSSGMQLRLAFAVAAFLEPEILIIDEVLSVGDAEFQKKCLGKMEDVSKSGRTILFVSHDLAAVEKLCARAILLQSGSIHMAADTASVVNYYLHKKLQSMDAKELVKDVRITQFVFGEGRIASNESVSFTISLSYDSQKPVITEFCILIYTLRGTRVGIIDLRDHINEFEYSSNQISIRGLIMKLNLVEGDYQIGLHYGINYIVGEAQDVTTMTITDNNQTSIRRYLPQYRGVMELDYKLVKSNG
jgi:lipopolysaccharide transport system ATP-binding protein